MRLRSLLGTAEPILWLWCWAAENATNGDLSGFSVAEIEDAAGWKGADGKAFKALCDAGFIDVSADVSANRIVLHEWEDTAGAKISGYLRRKEKQRDLMRKRRSGSGDPDQREEEIRDKSNSNLLALTAPSEDSAEADSIRKVFAHYRTHKPRSYRDPQPTSKEWRQIRNRLREKITVEEICDSIDGYMVDPFSQGKNDRGAKYDGLDLITRDESHIRKGIEFKINPPQQSLLQQARHARY